MHFFCQSEEHINNMYYLGLQHEPMDGTWGKTYWLSTFNMLTLNRLQDKQHLSPNQVVCFPVTLWAIHPRPSYNPSPVRAQQPWMCQSWFLMLWRERASVISAGDIASLRSCLLANTSTTACSRSPCWSSLKSSSFMMEIRARSVLSITAMTASVPR